MEMVQQLTEDVLLLPSHLPNCVVSTGGLRNRCEGRARLKDKPPLPIKEGVTDILLKGRRLWGATAARNKVG